MSDFEKLKNSFKQKILEAKNSKEIESINSEVFGKKGFINSEFSKIGSLSQDDKKKIASQINKAKQELTEVFNKASINLQDQELNESIKKQKIDITLPESDFEIGLSKYRVYPYKFT